jgi:urea transport system permease protein
MAGALKQVRVNNGVRGESTPHWACCACSRRMPRHALTAAEAVFRSHDPAALPRWTARWRRKPIRTSKAASSRPAAALLSSSGRPQADRLNGIAIMRARGDIEARSTLGI